ncbi:hypothetical protein EVAR_79130_1 [Eumeta japonica]|uniref:Uncharacterized protein n=1 Tax=Eumeta variegata TaxID=151549 RepID=A0A4C1USY9_EUMVA|nr:hypothetical protein EVAR_79130_1 [Eumeta japonica]
MPSLTHLHQYTHPSDRVTQNVRRGSGGDPPRREVGTSHWEPVQIYIWIQGQTVTIDKYRDTSALEMRQPQDRDCTSRSLDSRFIDHRTPRWCATTRHSKQGGHFRAPGAEK